MTDQERFELEADRWLVGQVAQAAAWQELRELLTEAGGEELGWWSARLERARTVAEVVGFEGDLEDGEPWELLEELEEQCRSLAAGVTVRRLVRFELMGGGPAGWIEFTLDDDREVIRGELGYNDWFQSPRRLELEGDELRAAAALYEVELYADGLEQ